MELESGELKSGAASAAPGESIGPFPGNAVSGEIPRKLQMDLQMGRKTLSSCYLSWNSCFSAGQSLQPDAFMMGPCFSSPPQIFPAFLYSYRSP